MMRVFLTLAFVLAGALFSLPIIAQAETITDFSSVYTISQNGEVVVQETITYDFENADRHGIFRILKTRHPQSAQVWYKQRYVEIKDIAVTRNNTPEPFTQSNSSGEIEIKIGDAGRTITGAHTYTISYVLVGALSFGPAGAEFYWNVTGNDWQTSIQAARAVVISEALATDAACYVGVIGSTETCASQERLGNQAVFVAGELVPGEGLTIAAALDPTQVTLLSSERISFLPFGFGLAFVWCMFLTWYTYRVRIQGRIDRPVIAQYEPYADYLPMYTGVLVDGQLDPHDITAGILYLAEQGFFKITKTTRTVLLLITVSDYDITLLRPLDQVPTTFLRDVSQLLFPSSTTVGSVVAVSSLTKQSTKNTAIVQKLQNSIKTDLAANGFTTTTLPKLSVAKTVGLITLYVVFASFIVVPNGIWVLSMVGIYSLIIVGILYSPRRTTKGYEAQNHIEGFKLFLSVTDKDRFDFHNAPEKSPELFMKYLPYAVALRVEEKWAAVFADITIPNPDWYDGGSVGTFSAAALASDLGVFSFSFAKSSGTSGSSGGGSSGGGGGGGGGGSW